MIDILQWGIYKPIDTESISDPACDAKCRCQLAGDVSVSQEAEELLG
jgi:hypothetical protein